MRWSQLIADHPSWLFGIALSDPRPPVYPALLALLLSFGGDPLVTGRVLSAVVGALTVLFAALLLGELAGTRAAIAGAALFAISPFFFFHQRLAAVDSLFLLESILAVWLALRFPRDGIWPLAAAMAVAMGTRLVLSYALWPLLLACIPRSRQARQRFAGLFAASLALWSPYLLAHPSLYEPAPLIELRRRILFHQSAGGSGISFEAMARNAREIADWLWIYLTPPVCLAATSAPFLLGWRRRTTTLLLFWLALLTIPLIVFGSNVYSRYFLAGAAPVLLLAACLAALPRVHLAVAVVVLLSLWPAREVWLQLTNWREMTLTSEDRRQYVTGTMAGETTEKAIAWLRARADRGPFTLLTGREWGVPADAVWIAFHDDPRVRLRFLVDSVPYDTKWSPYSSPAPVDEKLPVYGVFRGRQGDGIPAVERHEFTAHAQSVAVVRIR